MIVGKAHSLDLQSVSKYDPLHHRKNSLVAPCLQEELAKWWKVPSKNPLEEVEREEH